MSDHIHHYEINVSKDGRHLFATHARSITSKAHLDRVLPIIREKFPEAEGYKIIVTGQVEYGIVLEGEV